MGSMQSHFTADDHISADKKQLLLPVFQSRILFRPCFFFISTEIQEIATHAQTVCTRLYYYDVAWKRGYHSPSWYIPCMR